MFGLDASEMLLLVIVGIVVVGPKKLPQMMRTAGQWVAKLRKMSTTLRSQSGIDEILRIEGLEKEMRELRALTRINVMDSLVSVAERPLPVRAPRQLGSAGGGAAPVAAGFGASTAATEGAAAKPGAAKTGAVTRTSPKVAASSSPVTGSPAIATAESAQADGAAAAAESMPVKPPGEAPPGAVPRARPRAPIVMVALPGEAPLLEREWPRDGCDAYDALPDDLEEGEEEAVAAAAEARAAAEAEIDAEMMAATPSTAPPLEASAGEAPPDPTAGRTASVEVT